MVHCKELVGKVVSAFTIYEDSSEGPEICIAFTDGTVFSSCLRTVTSLEAKMTRDDGGQPQILKDYSTASSPGTTVTNVSNEGHLQLPGLNRVFRFR